ncbi:MAG: DUF421 domain-containing protein [Rhodothermales bacterium]|nr:DUF421 domain-containing protein [Rhodothermales bacterium]
MDWAWIEITWEALAGIVVTAVGIYLALIVLTRLAGLRSFSKMSSFDFAITVAFGSVVASVVVAEDPPLLQAVAALAVLYLLQLLVAYARTRSDLACTLVDNDPMLLMAGQTVLHENLKRAKVTEADLRAKLREANVIDLRQVRAVVMEATGDVSVLHATEDAPALSLDLLDGVIGKEHLEAQSDRP